MNYTVNVLNLSKPFIVEANKEDEAKIIVEKMLLQEKNSCLIEFFSSEIKVRKTNQHWFKEFIYNNF